MDTNGTEREPADRAHVAPLDSKGVRRLILARIDLARMSQAEAARAWRLSPQYLHDVISGRRAPGAKILRALKLRRVVAYLPE